MSWEEFEIRLPRHAFTTREVAPAVTLWEAIGDAAIVGSSRRGWTIPRYLARGSGFVVRAETVVHHREVGFGEPVVMATWVSAIADRVRSFRQFRLRTIEGELLVSAQQEWVHVSMHDMQACAVHPDILEDLPPVRRDPDPVFPPYTRRRGGEHRFALVPWHTWMDTLGHVNHSAYVRWCDEGIARVAWGAGIDPVRVVCVAEKMRFVAPVAAGAEVTVETRGAGVTPDGSAVFAHRVVGAGDRVCVVGTTVRRLVDGTGAELLTAWVQ